ncbi:lipoprotein-anchoring transpeptidase ErfK/SrfK [Hasllibacter halocynthiae]|uniref:Lipoprotein-anchoring transpeptidase ErfK/SrfK n=1 Tax=Hasllibacter halocynthiae TaxID=595589 RepID=A0A2T0X1D6_9RHOB|nr:L,D-transpeptidase [Hasllibacter halocynthiae]PRY92751.1 lipoprotein-anchoring transpeptidase ErfK/SrfK [Hasllibacter halocynthiae]
MDRRAFFATAAAAATTTLAAPAVSQSQWTLDPRFRAQRVAVRPGWTPGDIHVDPAMHHIYLIEEGDSAIRYGIAVGRDDLYVPGTFDVARKAEWPSWTPTRNMIEREPDLYAQFADGVPGGPDNPLGARALYLYRGGRDTYLRIHGTPQPWTIGSSVSSGCVRLLNDHIIDLYERVPTGTTAVLHA